jgi:hypothetical protein
MQRLAEERRAVLPAGFDDGTTYLQFEREDGGIAATQASIRAVERPPHATIR